MSIPVAIVGAVGGLVGILSTLYLAIGIPLIIGWKIYRKVRYGLSLYS